MKTNYLKFALVLIMLFAPVVIYFSCNKPAKGDENPSSTFVTVNKKQYNCANLIYKNLKNTHPEKGLTSGSPSCLVQENFLTSSLSQDEVTSMFTNIKASFSGDIVTNTTTPSVIVLYTNDSPLTTILYSDVKAISLFSCADNGLYTHYYYTVGSGLVTSAVSYFNQTGTFFYLDDLNSLCNIAGVNGFAEYGYDSHLTPTAAISDGLGGQILDTIPCMPNGSTGMSGGSSGCTEVDCGDPDCGECSDQGGWGCDGCCIINGLNTYGLANSLITTADTLHIYAGDEFENSFMSGYTMGQQYITYYHQIGYVAHIQNLLNAGNFTSHFTLAQELYTCANILQYGAPTDIPIPTTLQTDVTNMINYYKTVTTNVQFQTMLTQIQTDCNTYVGMSRASVLSSIH